MPLSLFLSQALRTMRHTSLSESTSNRPLETPCECQAVLSGRVPIIDFRKKQAYISEFLVQLEQEISDHDDFSRRVEEELTNLAEEFLAQKDAVLNELAIQRPKLIAAVEETKRIIAEKRYLEAFEVTTYLDDCILNGYKYAALEELRMFKGTIRAQEALENVVQYEISTSLLQEIILDIPVIKGQSMRLFSPIDLKMTQVALISNHRIDFTTAYCFIRHHTLLACGGNTHAEVYEINTQTGQTVRVSDMNFFRRWAGVYKYKEYVYAFGGNHSSCLSNAEKYDIVDKSWTNLPHLMQKAKEFCSVVEHSSGLYVSGYANPGGTSIEFFNLVNETFKLVRENSELEVPILLCVRDQAAKEQEKLDQLKQQVDNDQKQALADIAKAEQDIRRAEGNQLAANIAKRLSTAIKSPQASNFNEISPDREEVSLPSQMDRNRMILRERLASPLQEGLKRLAELRDADDKDKAQKAAERATEAKEAIKAVVDQEMKEANDAAKEAKDAAKFAAEEAEQAAKGRDKAEQNLVARAQKAAENKSAANKAAEQNAERKAANAAKKQEDAQTAAQEAQDQAVKEQEKLDQLKRQVNDDRRQAEADIDKAEQDIRRATGNQLAANIAQRLSQPVGIPKAANFNDFGSDREEVRPPSRMMRNTSVLRKKMFAPLQAGLQRLADLRDADDKDKAQKAANEAEKVKATMNAVINKEVQDAVHIAEKAKEAAKLASEAAEKAAKDKESAEQNLATRAQKAAENKSAANKAAEQNAERKAANAAKKQEDAQKAAEKAHEQAAQEQEKLNQLKQQAEQDKQKAEADIDKAEQDIRKAEGNRLAAGIAERLSKPVVAPQASNLVDYDSEDDSEDESEGESERLPSQMARNTNTLRKKMLNSLKSPKQRLDNIRNAEQKAANKLAANKAAEDVARRNAAAAQAANLAKAAANKAAEEAALAARQANAAAAEKVAAEKALVEAAAKAAEEKSAANKAAENDAKQKAEDAARQQEEAEKVAANASAKASRDQAEFERLQKKAAENAAKAADDRAKAEADYRRAEGNRLAANLAKRLTIPLTNTTRKNTSGSTLSPMERNTQTLRKKALGPMTEGLRRMANLERAERQAAQKAAQQSALALAAAQRAAAEQVAREQAARKAEAEAAAAQSARNRSTAEKARQAAEQAAKDRAAADKVAAKAVANAAQRQAAADKAAAQRVAAEQAAAQKAAEKAAKNQVARNKAATKAAAEQAARDKVATNKAAAAARKEADTQRMAAAKAAAEELAAIQAARKAAEKAAREKSAANAAAAQKAQKNAEKARKERETAEQAAKKAAEDAQRAAAAEKAAQEAATKKEADRLAKEQAARNAQTRKNAEKAQRQQAKAAADQAKKDADAQRAAAKKAAEQQAVAEKAAKQAAEKAAREKSATNVAAAKKAREEADKAAKEQAAAKKAAEKAAVAEAKAAANAATAAEAARKANANKTRRAMNYLRSKRPLGSRPLLPGDNNLGARALPRSPRNNVTPPESPSPLTNDIPFRPWGQAKAFPHRRPSNENANIRRSRASTLGNTANIASSVPNTSNVLNLGEMINEPIPRRSLTENASTRRAFDPMHRSMAGPLRKPEADEPEDWNASGMLGFNPKKVGEDTAKLRAAEAPRALPTLPTSVKSADLAAARAALERQATTQPQVVPAVVTSPVLGRAAAERIAAASTPPPTPPTSAQVTLPTPPLSRAAAERLAAASTPPSTKSTQKSTASRSLSPPSPSSTSLEGRSKKAGPLSPMEGTRPAAPPVVRLPPKAPVVSSGSSAPRGVIPARVPKQPVVPPSSAVFARMAAKPPAVAPVPAASPVVTLRPNIAASSRALDLRSQQRARSNVPSSMPPAGPVPLVPVAPVEPLVAPRVTGYAGPASTRYVVGAPQPIRRAAPEVAGITNFARGRSSNNRNIRNLQPRSLPSGPKNTRKNRQETK